MSKSILPSEFVKPERKVDKVFLHCSASNAKDWDDISKIKEFHTAQKPEGKGWNDVGYHYYITTKGTIQVGRPINTVPAAQEGHNTGSIAICCHGLSVKDFTEAQMKSLIELCAKIDSEYKDQITFHGHKEVANKLCPVFDYKRVLNLDPEGRFGDTEQPHYPTVDLGDDGDAVFILQKLLGIKPDGRFGPKTQAALIKYQKEIGITADGVAGPQTWNELL